MTTTSDRNRQSGSSPPRDEYLMLLSAKREESLEPSLAARLAHPAPTHIDRAEFPTTGTSGQDVGEMHEGDGYCDSGSSPPGAYDACAPASTSGWRAGGRPYPPSARPSTVGLPSGSCLARRWATHAATPSLLRSRNNEHRLADTSGRVCVETLEVTHNRPHGSQNDAVDRDGTTSLGAYPSRLTSVYSAYVSRNKTSRTAIGCGTRRRDGSARRMATPGRDDRRAGCAEGPLSVRGSRQHVRLTAGLPALFFYGKPHPREEGTTDRASIGGEP